MSHGATPKDVGKPPKVSEEALNNIRSIVREGLDVLGHSSDLYIGRELKGMWTEKDKGMSFYRLSVEAEDLVNGFIVFCRSEQRRSFRLVLCDADGKVMYTEDSRRNCSEATMYFTNIDTYLQFPVFRPEGSAATPVPGGSLFDTAQPGAASPHAQFAVPADECDTALGVFGALDGIKPSKKSIAPGKYLLCVLSTGQASLRGGGAYTLSMPIARRPKETVVKELVQADTEVFKSRAVLQELKTGYLKAKAEYVQWLQRAAEEEERIAGLLERKDRCYANFVDESLKASNLPVRPHVLHPRGAAGSSAAAWLTRQITMGKSAVSALLRSPSSSAPPTPQQQQRPVSSPNGMGHGGSQYSTPVKANSSNGPSPTPSSTGGKILARYVYIEGEEEDSQSQEEQGGAAKAGAVPAVNGISGSTEAAEEGTDANAVASETVHEHQEVHPGPQFHSVAAFSPAPTPPAQAASQPSPQHQQPLAQPPSTGSYSRVLDIYGSDDETEGSAPSGRESEPSADRQPAAQPALAAVEGEQMTQHAPHAHPESSSKPSPPSPPSPQPQASPAQAKSQSQTTKGYGRVLDIYGSDSDTEKDTAVAATTVPAMESSASVEPGVPAAPTGGSPSLAARLFNPSVAADEEPSPAVEGLDVWTATEPSQEEIAAQPEFTWPAQEHAADAQEPDFTVTQPVEQQGEGVGEGADSEFSPSIPPENGAVSLIGEERSPKHVHWPSGSPVASDAAEPGAGDAEDRSDGANISIEEPLLAEALVLDEPLPEQELHAAVVVEGDVYPATPAPEKPAQVDPHPEVEGPETQGKAGAKVEAETSAGPDALHVEVPEPAAEAALEPQEEAEAVGEPETPISEDVTPREESVRAADKSPKAGGKSGGGKKKKGKGKGKKATSSAGAPLGTAAEAEEEEEADATVSAIPAAPPASPPSKEPERETAPSPSPSPPRLSPEEEAARMAVLSEELLLEPMPLPEYQREQPQGPAGGTGDGVGEGTEVPAESEVVAAGESSIVVGSSEDAQTPVEPSRHSAGAAAPESATNHSQGTPAYAELPSPVKSTDSSSPRGEGGSPVSAAAVAAVASPLRAPTGSPMVSPGGYVSPMKPTGAIAGYGVNGYTVPGRPQSAPAHSPAPHQQQQQEQPPRQEPETQPPTRGLPPVRPVSASTSASTPSPSNGQAGVSGETESTGSGTGTGTGLARVAGHRHSTGTIRANMRYLEMPDPFAGW